MSQENKKVLLRIRNLKQYFPLKKKGLYVKANDGIDLDIYEGEVLPDDFICPVCKHPASDFRPL